MSALMTGLVLKHYAGKGGERMLAFAIADKADGNGENIYPGLKLLCEETKLGRSTVLRLLAKMQDDGWLQLVANAGGGRGKILEYRINPNWIKGLKLRPFYKQREGSATKQASSGTPKTKGSQNETLTENTKGSHPASERVPSECEKGPDLRLPSLSLSDSPSYSPPDPSLIRQDPQDARARRDVEAGDDPNDQAQLDKLQADYPAGTYDQSDWLIGRREASRRVEEGHRWTQLHDGVGRFTAQKRAQGKIGSEFITSPKNFFTRPALKFLEAFPLPVPAAERRERDALEKLVARRAVIGIPDFREPHPGETADQYRQAQDTAWDRMKNAPPASAVRDVLGKLAGKVMGGG